MRAPLQQLTIRAALILGFGLTFGVWLFAGFQFTRRMADVQQQAAAVSGRYMQAQDLLSNIRAQLLLGSVHVRDALLDPDPASTAVYRQQIAGTFEAIDEALRQYVPVLDASAEASRLARFQQEIGDFRQTVEDVLANHARGGSEAARLVLIRRVVPRREVVIRLSEDVQKLNRVAFVQQQTATADLDRATQRAVATQFSLALLGNLGIALLATVYVGRLERRVQRQRARDVQLTGELQELSGRLITAQEEERRRMARELHDEVGQLLTAAKMELTLVQRRLDAAGEQRELLAEAQSINDTALATVRDLSHLLHPALLDDLGLPAALEWYLRRFDQRHGIRAELVHDDSSYRLVPDVELTVYRIVQEALTNIARHARAGACRVYLQHLAAAVFVTVEDDGVGFDPSGLNPSGATRGLGLIGIRERVAQLHGLVRIDSAPGKGTRLTVELPAHRREMVPEVDAEAHGVAAALSEVLGG